MPGLRTAPAQIAQNLLSGLNSPAGALKKGVLQIVFNKISAAEVSSIPTLEQLDLLGDFQVSESTLQTLDDARFGKMERMVKFFIATSPKITAFTLKLSKAK